MTAHELPWWHDLPELDLGPQLNQTDEERFTAALRLTFSTPALLRYFEHEEAVEYNAELAEEWLMSYASRDYLPTSEE